MGPVLFWLSPPLHCLPPSPRRGFEIEAHQKSLGRCISSVTPLLLIRTA